MRQLHSIWLMPAESDEAMLQAIVDELAARFDAPPFRPHLTLVEDMERSVDDLTPLAAKIAAGICGFAAPVREIGTSEQYFRSFYARFDAAGPLLELKRRAIATIAPGRLHQFMPHVSLLYGASDSPEKRAARVEMAQRLVGTHVRFDHICVVVSAKEIPIEAWAVRSSTGLGGFGGLESPTAVAHPL